MLCHTCFLSAIQRVNLNISYSVCYVLMKITFNVTLRCISIPTPTITIGKNKG